MKNIKLNLVKSAKAGFSLVEMLVVIAVIGVIAAIAIPNIGNINASAKKATATRNAQSIASTLNSALAAGWIPATAPADQAAIVALAQGTTVSPADGAFAGKVFTVGTLTAEAIAELAANPGMLSYDTTNLQVTYTPPAN